jgi:hypothetical protein
LGQFKFEDYEFEAKLGKREKRPMVVMENGARYIGEWLINFKIREGRGC